MISLVVLAAVTSHARESGEASLVSERLTARAEAKLDQSAQQTAESKQPADEKICKNHNSKNAGCC